MSDETVFTEEEIAALNEHLRRTKNANKEAKDPVREHLEHIKDALVSINSGAEEVEQQLNELESLVASTGETITMGKKLKRNKKTQK